MGPVVRGSKVVACALGELEKRVQLESLRHSLANTHWRYPQWSGSKPSSVPSLMILSSRSSRLISVRSTTWRISVAMPRTAKKRDIPRIISSKRFESFASKAHQDKAIILHLQLEEPWWVWFVGDAKSGEASYMRQNVSHERHRPLFFFLLRSAELRGSAIHFQLAAPKCRPPSSNS